MLIEDTHQWRHSQLSNQMICDTLGEGGSEWSLPKCHINFFALLTIPLMYMEVKAHFESKIRLKKTLCFVNQSFLYLKIILCQMTYAAGVRKVSQIIWIAPNQITTSMMKFSSVPGRTSCALFRRKRLRDWNSVQDGKRAKCSKGFLTGFGLKRRLLLIDYPAFDSSCKSSKAFWKCGQVTSYNIFQRSFLY